MREKRQRRELPPRVRRISAVLNQARILNQRWENFRDQAGPIEFVRNGAASCGPFMALLHCVRALSVTFVQRAARYTQRDRTNKRGCPPLRRNIEEHICEAVERVLSTFQHRQHSITRLSRALATACAIIGRVLPFSRGRIGGRKGERG